MTPQTTSELDSFHHFIGEKLGNGGAALTPEECLELWRAEHPTDAELDASVAAVGRALEQAQRGEGKSLDTFAETLRRKHNLPRDV